MSFKDRKSGRARRCGLVKRVEPEARFREVSPLEFSVYRWGEHEVGLALKFLEGVIGEPAMFALSQAELAAAVDALIDDAQEMVVVGDRTIQKVADWESRSA